MDDTRIIADKTRCLVSFRDSGSFREVYQAQRRERWNKEEGGFVTVGGDPFLSNSGGEGKVR